MYYTYILYSKNSNKYYIGHINNIDRRLNEHNDARMGWASKYRPWEVIHIENFPTRSDAMTKEKYLKSLKNTKSLKIYIVN